MEETNTAKTNNAGTDTGEVRNEEMNYEEPDGMEITYDGQCSGETGGAYDFAAEETGESIVAGVPDVKSMRRRVNHIFFWLLLYTAATVIVSTVVVLILDPVDEYLMTLIASVVSTAMVYLCTFRKWPFRPFAKGRKKMTARDFFTLSGLLCIAQLFTTAISMVTEALGIEGTSLELGEMTVWAILYVVVFGPVIEELVFRGYIIGNSKGLGKKTSILLAAAAFGLMHGNLSQFIFAILAGAVLGFVFAEYSIWWAFLIHILNNGIAVLSMIVPEKYLDTVSVLVLLLFIGFAVYAIVQLIKRRGEIKRWFADAAGQEPAGAVRSILTSPWFIIYSLLFIAIIVTFMVFPDMARAVSDTPAY